MSSVNNDPAASGQETGAGGISADRKKHWNAPRLARLDGRSAMHGFPGATTDSATHTSAIS